MRRLGRMEHDECAPWCDHDPAHHGEDCDDAFCDGILCRMHKTQGIGPYVGLTKDAYPHRAIG